LDIKNHKYQGFKKGDSNVTVGTMLEVFETLKANVNFRVELMNQKLKII
jgi:hypothetical protein